MKLAPELKGLQFEGCIGCEFYDACHKGYRKACFYNDKTSQNDLWWRDSFHITESVFDGFTYGDIILMLRQEYPENRTPETVLKLAKQMIEERKDDMIYLLKLNMDRIIDNAN